MSTTTIDCEFETETDDGRPMLKECGIVVHPCDNRVLMNPDDAGNLVLSPDTADMLASVLRAAAKEARRRAKESRGPLP